MLVYTMQRVIQPVVQAVEQPVASCIQTFNRLSNWFNRLINRIDNRLYRVNGGWWSWNCSWRSYMTSAVKQRVLLFIWQRFCRRSQPRMSCIWMKQVQSIFMYALKMHNAGSWNNDNVFLSMLHVAHGWPLSMENRSWLIRLRSECKIS